MSNQNESHPELEVTIVTYEKSKYFHAFLLYGHHRSHGQSIKSPFRAIYNAMHNMIGAFVPVLTDDDLAYFRDEYEGRAAEEHYSEYPSDSAEDHYLGVAEMMSEELAQRWLIIHRKGEFE